MKSYLFDELMMGRRDALKALVGASAIGLASCTKAVPLSSQSNSVSSEFDYANPIDNLYAFGKIWAGYEQPQYGAYHGVMYARVPGRAHEPLFGYTGTGVMQARTESNGDLSIRGKETGFFTDLASGEVIEEWLNPFTGERITPFNFINTVGGRFTTTIPRFAFGGADDEPTISNHGLNKSVSESDEIPFILPFESYGDDLLLSWDYAHGYTNPVTKDKWPKAHTSEKISPSEHFTFHMSKAALENRDIPSVRFVAGFSRVSEWWPWMRMGGNKYQDGTLFGRMFSHKGLSGYQDIPPKLLAYIEKHHPESLEIPNNWNQQRPKGTWEKYAQNVPPEIIS